MNRLSFLPGWAAAALAGAFAAGAVLAWACFFAGLLALALLVFGACFAFVFFVAICPSFRNSVFRSRFATTAPRWDRQLPRSRKKLKQDAGRFAWISAGAKKGPAGSCLCCVPGRRGRIESIWWAATGQPRWRWPPSGRWRRF